MTLDLAVLLRPRRTLLVRLCTGATFPGCGRELGSQWVPWRGTPLVESDGVCAQCLAVESAPVTGGPR